MDVSWLENLDSVFDAVERIFKMFDHMRGNYKIETVILYPLECLRIDGAIDRILVVSLRRGPPCLIYLMDENAYLRTFLRSGRRQWGLRF